MRRAAAALVAGIALIVPASGMGTHIRPKAAMKINVSLVPSYLACAAPDRTHGPPLSFPSCSGPQLASGYLTVGTQSVANFYWKAIPGVPGPPTDNVSIFDASITDVRCTAAAAGCAAPGADYAGSVEVRLPSQISDHNNNPNPGGGIDPATMQPFNFGFTVPCAMTADPSIGSTCSKNIHYLENIIPGGIPDSKRTVWEISQVQVLDGGADADGSTAGDNTRFAVQGLFVP